MAQCLKGAEKRTSDSSKDLDVQGCKRLKQVHLSFKPVDRKPLAPTAISSNNSSKKRKSCPESPTLKPKLSKLPDLRSSAEKSQPSKVHNENEVSSSSEADNLSTSSSKLRQTGNILEKFVRREDEISSTNDVIDLTSTENEENSPMKIKSPKKAQPQLKAESQQIETEGNEKECSTAETSRDVESEEKVNLECEKNDYRFVRKLDFENEKSKVNHETSDEALDDGQGDKEEKPCDKENADKKSVNEDENKEDKSVAEDSEEEDQDDITIESESEQDTSEVLEGKDVSSCKTPLGKKLPLCASTPQTEKSGDTSCSSVGAATPSSQSKPLTKKQQALADKRAKAKEEKERLKQEAQDKKERELLEKKKKKDEEKAEKEKAKAEEKEKKEKERQEKKDLAEKEKQEKLKQKEEEKKKKQDMLDAREEEKKTKEEERRLKEEEKKKKEEHKQKEEEEQKKQAEKRKAAFTSFFSKPKVITSTKVDKAVVRRFIPFACKKDMTLAPTVRRTLTSEQVQTWDQQFNSDSGENFLTQLRQGITTPVRTNRVLRKLCRKVELEEDVELLVHDSEAVKKSQHAVKILLFHTDYRPPYCGTWRKRHANLCPRNPWKKYEGVFDYEVDSDEEWEEEEPGESLSDSNGEEDEGEEKDEDEEEDGWMVPHGYLSVDEGCEDDEEITPEVLKARQRAKAQAWETELKAKREVAPPTHIGCVWANTPCCNPQHLNTLRQFEMMFLRSSPVETLISCPHLPDAADKGSSSSSKATPGPKGVRKRALPEEAMPDLIRLVHGNSFGIKKLVREFRLYWRRKTNPAATSLNESKLEADVSMETDGNVSELREAGTEPKEAAAGVSSNTSSPAKTDSNDATTEDGSNADTSTLGKALDVSQDESALDDNCVSKRQLEMKINAIAVREKREGCKKVCWYVNGEVLKQYNMADQPTENSWVYVSITVIKKVPSVDVPKKTPKKVLEESKTPDIKTAIMKTPKVAKVKKTPNKSKTEEKTPCKLADASGSEVSSSLSKDIPSLEGTPNADKNKEGSDKKKSKDQPSIMAAFTKKTPVKPPTKQPLKNKILSKANEVIDVDMEANSQSNKGEIDTSSEKPELKADKNQPSIFTAFGKKTGLPKENPITTEESKKPSSDDDKKRKDGLKAFTDSRSDKDNAADPNPSSAMEVDDCIILD